MSNGKTKELLSYMNSFNSSDEIDEKLNCLKSIISYSQYTVSDYKTVIYFLIEKTLTIHSLFEKESAETNEIKKYLNNFTKFNDDYKCVNELYQGFYSFKLIELNSDSNSTTNTTFYYKKDNSLLPDRYETLEKILKEEHINLIDVYNALSTIRFDTYDKGKQWRIIEIYFTWYHTFSKSQKKQLKEIYDNYLTSLIGRKSIKKMYIEIFLPDISQYEFKFPITDCKFTQTLNGLFSLYYYITVKESELNEVDIMKFYFIIQVALESFTFELEELNKFYLLFLFFKQKEKLSTLHSKHLPSQDSLFPKQITVMKQRVYEMISFFYNISPSPLVLLTEDNINFTVSIVELYYYNQKYIHNDLSSYQNNLLSLESQIFDIYKENTHMNKGLTSLKTFFIDEKLKLIFYDLVSEIRKEITPFCRMRDLYISFFPFGSVTQFLSGDNADLDIYMNIKANHNDSELTTLTNLLSYIEKSVKKIDNKMVTRVTTRLCLFTFEYRKVKIDLNVFGICSVLGSSLLREYSLYDARLSILGVTLKSVIKKYKIKNNDNMKNYLNSFSWMLLLITFLQDVIDPPVLPKLLSITNVEKHSILVGGKMDERTHKKRLGDVIETSYRSEFYLADFTKIKEYDNFVSLNKMSCSELFIKFTEFIGFFFNSDYVFVNAGFEKTSFMPKLNIKNLKFDVDFSKFYKRILKRTMQGEQTKMLIREPFDHSYNPANEVKPEFMNIIQKTFRDLYRNMIKNGEL